METMPALKCHMGTWDYYVVRMTMKELGKNIDFANDIHTDTTLSEAIQRELQHSRVNDAIVSYLVNQPDRFFSSLVVAAVDKSPPQFLPVSIEDIPEARMLANDPMMKDSFGVLAFTGRQKYYAVDGQHRLAAIKNLLERDPQKKVKGIPDPPEGFEDDEVSVVMVIPRSINGENEDFSEFLVRYRRLFSNLNRNAKPTDKRTNIIMDEDDALAILTRRLIHEHEFFRYTGSVEGDSPVVKATAGKNLRMGDGFFTSLETLYDMNISLLTTNDRQVHGWRLRGEATGETNLKKFQRFRPPEDFLDELYEELHLYWDGLLHVLPDLRNVPQNMRTLGADPSSDTSDDTDSFLFWPLTQMILGEAARVALNKIIKDPNETLSIDLVREALAGFGDVEFRLNRPPWVHFLREQNPDNGRWRMRNEDRKEVAAISQHLLLFGARVDRLLSDEIDELRNRWSNRIQRYFDKEKGTAVAYTSEQKDDMWEQFAASG